MNKLGWNLQTFFFVYKNWIYLFLQIWQKITFFKVSFKIRILEGLLIIFKVRQTHLIEFCYYCLIFIFRIICIFENLFASETIFEILESNFHFRINWIFEKLFVYWTFVKILESNFHFSKEFYFRKAGCLLDIFWNLRVIFLSFELIEFSKSCLSTRHFFCIF